MNSSEHNRISTPGPLTAGLEYPSLEGWTFFFEEARRLADLARQRRKEKESQEISTTSQETTPRLSLPSSQITKELS